MATCEPDQRYVSFHFWRAGDDENQMARRNAATKLLLASIVRDFVVVEEREKVFGNKVERGAMRSAGHRGDGPILVYLPRVRYMGQPDIGRCAAELGHQQRRSHQVAAHLRRADSASDTQLILARRYGFTIPKGYTFVRPHERGAEKRETIYRSRSALKSLFTVVDEPTEESAVRWFDFERDVHDLLGRLGMQVQHVSASRAGDNGVDVYATITLDIDTVNWVVQCKCYRPDREIGPSIVRELIGTLHGYPMGTKGMVVTTSRFTRGARKEGEKAGIRLIDGHEFQRLLDVARTRADA